MWFIFNYPKPEKYLKNFLQTSFLAVISLKLLALERSNWNWQNHTFNFIYISFRPDKKHKIWAPERKAPLQISCLFLQQYLLKSVYQCAINLICVYIRQMKSSSHSVLVAGPSQKSKVITFRQNRKYGVGHKRVIRSSFT